MNTDMNSIHNHILPLNTIKFIELVYKKNFGIWNMKHFIIKKIIRNLKN